MAYTPFFASSLLIALIFLPEFLVGTAFVIAPQTSTCEALSRWSKNSMGQQQRQQSPFQAAASEWTNDNSKEGEDEVDLKWLKTELQAYMQKRQEVGADDLAKQEVGKVVGGTKGNPVLEFVSGAPNKEFVIEKANDALSYGELQKYGYGFLATPMMKAGGRFAMYELLGLDPPETRSPIKPIQKKESILIQPEIQQGYKGMKLGQAMDDDLLGEALQKSFQKSKEQATETNLLIGDERRNIAPRQTPDWTPERLDELGRAQGRAEAWARRAKDGELTNDSNESFELSLQQRAFSILTLVLFVTAFGKSTDAFLIDLLKVAPDQESATLFKEALQPPGLALLVASIGSSVLASIQSKEKNRNAFIWFVKGLLGGPFTIALLRNLEPLLSTEEQEKAAAQRDSS